MAEAKEKTRAGYGSIYLDAGEDTVEQTEKQLKAFAKDGVDFVFFDIIAKEDQVAKAMASRGYVQKQMYEALELDHHQIYVAIGYSENERPARDTMMKYVTK